MVRSYNKRGTAEQWIQGRQAGDEDLRKSIRVRRNPQRPICRGRIYGCNRNRAPFDLAVTWWLISVRGVVEGAAIAFAIHAGVEAVAHLVIAESFLPEVTGS